jgi:diacylglycerol kinase (ATP)
MPRPWVAIQRNPTSGGGAGRAELLAMCRRFVQLGIRPRLFSRRDRLSERLGRPDSRQGLVGLIAAGGDGTVGDLVNRFPDLPLAVLPLGTENLLAKYLGIPADGRLVAELVARGETRRIDVGLVNGRRFLLMMTAGFDAEVIRRCHESRRGNILKWSYIQPILETLRSYRYPQLRVEVADGEIAPTGSLSASLRGPLVVLANLPAYALGLPLADSAVGDDGLLDLRLFQQPSAFQMARYLYKVTRRQHENLPDVDVGRVRRVRIESDVPVPVQCDGDPVGWTPVDVSVLPRALTLFAPDEPVNRRRQLAIRSPNAVAADPKSNEPDGRGLQRF